MTAQAAWNRCLRMLEVRREHGVAKYSTLAAFIASWILRDLAFSVPVLDGFGLSIRYMLLHAVLALLERGPESREGGI